MSVNDLRTLTRNEVRKAAATAGIKPDDPIMFDGRAEALLNTGVVIGAKMSLNFLHSVLHRENQNARGNREGQDAGPEAAGVDVEVPHK